MNQRKFSQLILVIIAGSILVTTGGVFWHYRQSVEPNNESAPEADNQPSTSTPPQPSSSVPSEKTNSADEPPLLLKSIGIDLDYYDSNTGMAGDFLFTRQELKFNRLFMGFAFVIPSDMSGSGKDKANPQPTFVVPLGTPVRALVDGVVASIPTLWSGDYSIMITTNGTLQKWIYETEHIINPTVKVGDKVTAGQIVGEVSDFDDGAPDGFGTVEIGILKGGQTPEHVCPFAYLDDSIREETFKKMNNLFKSWEDYVGDQTLYEETAIPGCLTLDSIEG